MKSAGVFVLLVGFAAVAPIAHGGGQSLVESENDRHFADEFGKALRALRAGVLRAGMPMEEMLDQCLPKYQRRLGRFTDIEFGLGDGYIGISVAAKDDRLKSAVYWHCTGSVTFFDELTEEGAELYQKLRIQSRIPIEQRIGRWGWRRSPMREWMPDRDRPATSPKK